MASLLASTFRSETRSIDSDRGSPGAGWEPTLRAAPQLASIGSVMSYGHVLLRSVKRIFGPLGDLDPNQHYRGGP